MNGSRLYFGEVMHRRLREFRYRFVYRVFSLYLDVDELPSLHRRLRLFSYNRFNLVSFHDRDHGPRDGRPLRPWLESLLRAHDIDLEGGPVHLLCFPRILGYGFNPLSVWYCWHADGSLRAIICEVRNTFGGMHHYLLASGGAPLEWRREYRARKEFHVSPFIAPNMEYRFRFRAPGETVGIYISEHEIHSIDDRLVLKASISGQRLPLTDANLLGMCGRVPFMTLKVMIMIHWQALKLWVRGGRVRRMPDNGLYYGAETVTRGWGGRDR